MVGGLALVAIGNLLLATAGAGAGYVADLLPGFLLSGAGVGLVFVAVTVAAMSEIEDERAGLASGLMTSAHEVGGAFGVSIFAAVALANGTGGGAIADGYSGGALAAPRSPPPSPWWRPSRSPPSGRR